MLKVIRIAPLLVAICGVARAQSSGEITVRTLEDVRAQSTSTLATSCGTMKLRIVAPYGDSVGANGIEPVTMILNGRKLDLQQTGISERIGLKNRLYKYTPLCSQSSKEMYVRYYSVHREGGEIRFTAGRFSLFPDGRIVFNGEDTTDKDGFWFG